MRGVWRLLAPLSFALSSAPVALWQIIAKRPDVVLVVEPTLFVAPVALFAAKIVRARTVLHVQDLEIDAAFAVGHLNSAVLQKLALFFERRVLGAFDFIISISRQMCTKLEAKGVNSHRLSLVRNWVDLKKIVPMQGSNRFREELQLSDDTFVALYAGSIGAKQALDVLLDAAVQLKSETGIVFVIAGDGPAKAPLITKYGQLPNVRFLPVQPEERLCELLNLADLHVLPQARGAADLVLPSKLGGMLASGRAILVAAEPDTELHDFLKGIAVIVPVGNSARIAEEIRHLAHTRPETSEKLIQLATTFDSEKNLEALASVLASVCRARR